MRHLWPLPGLGKKLAPHILLGKCGERVAMCFLRAKGYRILGRNVRLGKDEIDIIAFDPLDQVIAFVEVKTRAADGPYSPELNVTAEKRLAMARAAKRWIAKHFREERGYRLDVITVVGKEVREHFVEVEC